jgi:hypothetical protein
MGWICLRRGGLCRDPFAGYRQRGAGSRRQRRDAVCDDATARGSWPVRKRFLGVYAGKGAVFLREKPGAQNAGLRRFRLVERELVLQPPGKHGERQDREDRGLCLTCYASRP